jgi:hypothetical protein
MSAREDFMEAKRGRKARMAVGFVGKERGIVRCCEARFSC